jgi:acetyl-CoA carboxylase biotin carboxyl carrier protein
MNLDLDDLKNILTLVREHGVSELEIEREGWRLKVRHGIAAPAASAFGQLSTVLALAPSAGAPAAWAIGAHIGGTTAAPVAVTAATTSDEADIELAVVKSPIVGTFYRSSEPGAPPFVDVGQQVKKDQVLCIIEAMKLMNEITSEYEGEVASVYVENGKPVQYGERLFAIKTSA